MSRINCISKLSPDCRGTMPSENKSGHCKPCYELAIREGRIEKRWGGRPKAGPPLDPASVEYLLTELREMKGLLLESIRDVDIEPAERRLFIEQARKLTVSIQEITLSDLKSKKMAQEELDSKQETYNHYLSDIQAELLKIANSPERLEAMKHSLTATLGATTTTTVIEPIFDIIEPDDDDDEDSEDYFSVWDQG